MSDHKVIDSVSGAVSAKTRLQDDACLANSGPSPSGLGGVGSRGIYKIAWSAINVLILASMFFVLYAMAWEYSTRRYLAGFSDAVVPAGALPEEKISAILSWMSNGPARRTDPIDVSENRDPTDTLNYRALLQVCGSATNAFINLADSSGLPARRLLLLDSTLGTRHVVAEVRLNGQWIVVDPSFRAILRGATGQMLTRHDLADPKVFADATQAFEYYDPSYNYTHTEHVRLERIPLLGSLMRNFLSHLFPSWEESPGVSLLVERESFAAMIVSFLMLSFLILLRVFLRWLGETRLGVRTPYYRERMRRAARALVTPPH